jgi:hypothetical protein
VDLPGLDIPLLFLTVPGNSYLLKSFGAQHMDSKSDYFAF